MKETNEKNLMVRVPRTLLDDFKSKCDSEYKTVSEVIRHLMFQYVSTVHDSAELCTNNEE